LARREYRMMRFQLQNDQADNPDWQGVDLRPPFEAADFPGVVVGEHLSHAV